MIVNISDEVLPSKFSTSSPKRIPLGEQAFKTQVYGRLQTQTNARSKGKALLVSDISGAMSN